MRLPIFWSLAMIVAVACQSDRTDLTKPDENRFTPVVLTPDGSLDEPMGFEVTSTGKVFIYERKGALKLFDPLTGMVTLAGSIPVNTKYTNAEGVETEAEEGFMGFTLDPGFEKNHWVYLYYAHPTESKHILTRWEIMDDKLVEGSAKTVLEVVTQREVCCHTGGGMTWDKNGNLYLSVGNNTGNVADKSQTDERPGRSSWDDQRGSGNTNDLRGKILRIHPEPDGTYTIPDGNLFPAGTAGTRPEIYTMGHRNPWRISIDSKTGWMYWGEVGPDASEDTPSTKAGMDELNQAKGPGNFGWPYFIGENRGYPYYDYVNDTLLAENDPLKPLNHSVNNTGLKELPPAQPAFISYPYGLSEKFPEVGTGSRSAVGGPVYHRTDFPNARRPFPAYYENKWLAADFSRGWIMSITMDEKGNYSSMERLLSTYQPVEPIDIKFGPDGDLYVLEYGSNWFRKSDNARLVRIEYNAGNRAPRVKGGATASGGAIPFKVTLNTAGTIDYDGDELTYGWKVYPEAGGDTLSFAVASPEVTLSLPGAWLATLTVSDPSGAGGNHTIRLVAGNEPPAVELTVSGNQSFFFPDTPVQWKATVMDKEDGTVNEDQVSMSVNYVSDGFDIAEVAQQQRSVDASTRHAVAKLLIDRSDCNNCHHVDTRSVGPMLNEIAVRYKGNPVAADSLVKKIRQGGGGVWGEVNMPAHPAITANDARLIVDYILDIGNKTIRTLPLSGTHIQDVPEGDNGLGSLILRAAYTDRSAQGSMPLTAEKSVVLRAPNLAPDQADIIQDATLKKSTMFIVAQNVIPVHNGFIAFNGIDLTGVKKLELTASANPRDGSSGGTIEVRTGSPAGELLGSVVIEAVDPFKAMMSQAQAVQDGGGKDGKKPAPAQRKPKRQPVFDFGALMRRPGVPVLIKPSEGIVDLYLVFKNDQVKPKQPLLSISKIRLHNN